MKNKIVILAALIVLALVSFVELTAAQHTSEVTEMASFSLISPTLSLHEPVLISFEVRNTLAEEIKLDLGADRKGAFRIGLTNPDGEVMNGSPFGKEGIRFPGVVTVSPGETFQRILLVNEWHKFPESGDYKIAVEIEAPIESSSGNAAELRKKSILKLEITERDPDKLRAVCIDLLDRILASGPEQSETAALALTYIKDPIAVPYLRTALASARRLEYQMIKALLSIGDVEAVRALISVLDSNQGEVKELARSALLKLESESTDPEIKEIIRRAMKKGR